jgi:branched-chain amino acid transport system ATP-binding protein
MTPAPVAELPLLRIEGLTKRFGGFTALDNVSVDIKSGERFGLIGPNGSGKTTLINCISGAFRTEPSSVARISPGWRRMCGRGAGLHAASRSRARFEA